MRVDKMSRANKDPEAMFVHLAVFAGVLFPLGNIIGPLVVWLLQRDKSPEIDKQGKGALNFQISMTLYTIILFIVFLSLSFISPVFMIASFLVIFSLFIANAVFVIKATIASKNGKEYKYPLVIRFIK